MANNFDGTSIGDIVGLDWWRRHSLRAPASQLTGAVEILLPLLSTPHNAGWWSSTVVILIV